MKNKRNGKGETWKTFRISKLQSEVTGFAPIHSGCFVKTQPFQASLANLSPNNEKPNALWRKKKPTKHFNNREGCTLLMEIFPGKKKEGTGKETKMVKRCHKKVKKERRGHASLVYLGMCHIEYYGKVSLSITNFI